MRVIRLFIQQDLTSDTELELDANARHHACNVLRINKHSKLVVFNGDGFDYKCEILNCSKSNLQVKVVEQIKLKNESSLNTHLYLGISKSSHMDYAIQKTVEVGVSTIQPVLMERTINKVSNKSLTNKHKHWQGIIQSACEQSGRAIIPKLLEATKMQELQALNEDEYGLIFDSQSDQNIQSLGISYPETVKLFVGTEGGLTDTERELALEKGFYAVNCGPRILRTETAALTAVILAQREWGDLAC